MPKLSVMGYVECKYDKYGNIISNTGTVAGDLKWSGDISWQFATPIGPMYLKLGAEGKAFLKMTPSLWDTTRAKGYMDARNYMSAGEVTEPQFICTDFADENTGWLGNGKNARAVMIDKKDLQKGLLPSSPPMLAQIGGKQVLVWQEYDKTRDMANSAVLMYSVFENGVWSDPAAVCDDGYGDVCADLQVIGGKLCLTWQEHKMEQAAGEAPEAVVAMAESAEICYAEFDEKSDTFTAVTQVTDNALCDMMPRFVSGSDEVQIAWVRNDANSIMQSEGVNSIYVSKKVVLVLSRNGN